MRLLVLMAAVAAMSCAPLAPASAAGTWSGTYSAMTTTGAPAGSGPITLILVQNGNSVSGSASITPYGTGNLVGSYSSSSGRLQVRVALNLGAMDIDGDAETTSMSGTFLLPTGDSGAFNLRKGN